MACDRAGGDNRHAGRSAQTWIGSKTSRSHGQGRSEKAAAAAARAAANRMLADNRQARHQYEILETLETGIELVGTEVKSIRNGKANLRDGFCLIRNGELQLHNVHISPHTHAGSYFNHDLRTRKLLAIAVRSTSCAAWWIRKA